MNFTTIAELAKKVSALRKPLKSDNLNETLKLNRFLANPVVMILYILLLDLIFILLFNYVINVIFNLPAMIAHPTEFSEYVSWSQFGFKLRENWQGYKFIYIPFFIVMIGLNIRKAYYMRVAFGEEDINKGTAGTSRWTTIDEIKEQYKEIEMLPSKVEYIDIKDADKISEESIIERYVEDGNGNKVGLEVRTPNYYEGKGGLPVMRIKNKLYIDPQPTNNLFLGTTRSGKGEMFVFPIIDIVSRAREIKNRPSMIIFDPKLELYKSSKHTLEKRGYKIRLLNLDDPMRSAGYNPLEIVTRYYANGELDTAQELARSFSFSIFNSTKDMSEPIWKNTATDLFTALIIAVVSDCIEEDKKLNEIRRANCEYLKEVYRSLEPDVQEDALMQFNNVICYLPEGEDILDEEYRRRYNAIPESYEFTEIYPNRKKINCYSVINFFRELCDVSSSNSGKKEAGQKKADTALDDYFNNRPTLDYARSLYLSIKTAGDRTKGSIFVNMQSALTIFSLNSIATMTAESDIDFEEIGFGEKPVAIYLGLPTENKSNHFLALNFVTQVFQYLFKLAKARKGELDRNVRFILDEFGNMPILDSFSSMVTNCIGVGFTFDIFIQSYNQLHTNYEMEMDTIKDNFANQVYILAQGNESAEEFSKQLGNKTIIEVQRTGTRFSTEKSITENSKERPLLFPAELKVFKEGEVAIIRGTKRTDIAGAGIESYPIICEYADKLNALELSRIRKETKEKRETQGEMLNRDTKEKLTFNQELKYNISILKRYLGTAFFYRWQYATADFPNATSIEFDDICVETRRHIAYEKRVVDTKKVADNLEKINKASESDSDTVTSKKPKKPAIEEPTKIERLNQARYILREYIGDDFEMKLGLREDERQNAQIILQKLETYARGSYVEERVLRRITELLSD